MIQVDALRTKLLKESFTDMPVEIFRENIATQTEKQIIDNTYLMLAEDSRDHQKIGARGMIVHLKDGYFATALHCFKYTTLMPGDTRTMRLKSSNHQVYEVTLKVIEAGASVTGNETREDTTDWIIFHLEKGDLPLNNLSLNQLKTPHERDVYRKRFVSVGVPGDIQINPNDEGSESFVNTGHQMSVRFDDATNVRQIYVGGKIENTMLEVRAEANSSSGYSGGPFIVDGSHLAGIIYTAGSRATLATSTEYLLERLKILGIEFDE